MKTYLVTGAAGFIGANYIKHILAKHDDVKFVILDALTYAATSVPSPKTLMMNVVSL